VSGQQLSFKTPNGQWSVPATELHDAWWNSLARAMS
jgi:hypothetical protein